MPSLPSRSMGALEWGMLLALSLLWGGSFLFNGVAVKELPPLTIVFTRLALAAAILLIVVHAFAQGMPRAGAAWFAFFGIGLLNNVIPMSLIVWGQGHIASGVASILNAMTPLFTVIVAHILTRDEKMSAGALAGVFLGIAGVAIMTGGEALKSLGMSVVAQLACIVATISYAFAGVFGRRFKAMGVTPLQTATGQAIASSLIMLPFVLTIERPWALAAPGLATILALIGLGALSTALAYILFFRILATAGAANLSLVTFLIPVSAIFFGTTLLGEVLQPKQIIGMAMIGFGLAAIDGRLLKKLKGG